MYARYPERTDHDKYNAAKLNRVKGVQGQKKYEAKNPINVPTRCHSYHLIAKYCLKNTVKY